jgi:hypothetical protein
MEAILENLNFTNGDYFYFEMMKKDLDISYYNKLSDSAKKEIVEKIDFVEDSPLKKLLQNFFKKDTLSFNKTTLLGAKTVSLLFGNVNGRETKIALFGELHRSYEKKRV